VLRPVDPSSGRSLVGGAELDGSGAQGGGDGVLAWRETPSPL